MADSYTEITKDDFAEKVLNVPSPQLVVVNFTVPQSNACLIQEPEIVAVSQEYQDRMTFVNINVEGQEELTKQWNVEGVPTLIFFRGGKELYRIKGIVMRNRLRRQIEGVLLVD
ncbi:MAG TPA: thioredoxin family protein [Ktedonobacteraceae bacterium]|jgi:thioredoxin 1|nr:thioredoxin family protein [Ktedonobacteraceae bacterium]